MNRRKLNKAIQVALVEDDAGVRANLAALLNTSPGFSCQAAYPDAMTALKAIPGNRPDVVLMDINMPGMPGTECVSRLKTAAPALPGADADGLRRQRTDLQIFDGWGDRLLAQANTQGQAARSHPRITNGGAPMSRQIARRVVQFFHEIKQMPPAPERAPEVESLTEREEQVLVCWPRACLQGNRRPDEHQLRDRSHPRPQPLRQVPRP